MSLEEYQRKRKFNKTSEPKGQIRKTSKNRFVVQEHHASHLHWDFRLEMDGVLKSWAVPKGVPVEPEVKHLAVEVEDHPVGYLNFEGKIPEGQYGAGEVKFWDRGAYELVEKNDKKISFKLFGQKLKGHYHLIKTGWQGKKNSWLIFKS